MSDATTALLPCPFCGGSVTLEEARPTYDRRYGERRWWGVVCRNTINLGGTCAIEQSPSASTEAAIARWNRRATPPAAAQAEPREPATREEVERLRAAICDAIWNLTSCTERDWLLRELDRLAALATQPKEPR